MNNNPEEQHTNQNEKPQLNEKEKHSKETKQPAEKLSDDEIRRQLGWYLTEKKKRP